MTARGIRNNNLGNLRHGDKWQGLAQKQTDSAFCQFESMEYGCRALMKTLQTYHDKYGLDTMECIITRWAPTNENDTESYINSVSKQLGVNPNESLDLEHNPQLYLALAKAIALHENGREALDISDETWDKAYKLAFNA